VPRTLEAMNINSRRLLPPFENGPKAMLPNLA
jgi:hypothetical protein